MHSLETILDQYHSKTNQLDEQLRVLRTKSFRLSAIRFLVFAGVAFSIYGAAVFDHTSIWVIMAVILIALFLFLIKRHVDIKYHHSMVDKLLKINHNEIQVLQQNPSFLPDGSEFHEEYTYSADLDIFGPRSLFHLIQRCFSPTGRTTLAAWLTHPDYHIDEIYERHRAIENVTDQIDLRQKFLAHGLVHFTGTESPFDPDSPLMSSSVSQKIKLLRWVVPLITLGSIMAAITLEDNNLLLYGFILNLIITGLFAKTTSKVMLRADENLKSLANYKQSLQVMIRGDYDAPMLRKKKKILTEAHRQFHILQKRYDLLESRTNPLMGLLLNGIMGFDFLVLSRLDQWYRSHAQSIPLWEKEIGWVEAIFSLANFSWNNPTYTYPRLDRDMGIVGDNIRHPFIPEKTNIGNAFDLTDPLKVVILTGSNMSGKSTFLRSIGVNQVLALTGSVVAADKMHTGLYGLLTSFRKADSIQEHTSLFYDELKKLKFIFTTIEATKRPHLILLDEILRGTNSDDKYYGSKQVLLRLKDQGAMAILATHDIALARLEEGHGPIIQNYSFESQIIDGELNFDYQLHRGVAINKNATFLMEKMGIIREQQTK